MAASALSTQNLLKKLKFLSINISNISKTYRFLMISVEERLINSLKFA